MNIIYSLTIVWFTLVFFISGLFINFLQLCVLPLYWLKKDWYHLIIPGLSYCIYSQLTFAGEWWGSINLKVYVEGDFENVGKESALVICNHYSDVDWLVAWIFAERLGLSGHSKVISKDTIKYIPVLGWSAWFGQFGFLSRNWQNDKKHFYELIQSMRENSNYFLMGLLCEGTRRTEEKLKSSQEYSRKNNIEPLKHHLLPRPKGFSLIVEALHDNLPAIYDYELAFPAPEQAHMKNILLNRGTVDVVMHFKRISLSTVPKTYGELTEYLMDHYRYKDSLYDTFLETGKFPGTVVSLPRKHTNLLLFLVWNVIVTMVTVSMLRYVTQTFSHTMVVILFLLVALLVCSFMNHLIQYSRADRGSRFGLKDK